MTTITGTTYKSYLDINYLWNTANNCTSSITWGDNNIISVNWNDNNIIRVDWGDNEWKTTTTFTDPAPYLYKDLRKTPQQKLQEIIKTRHAPAIHRRKALNHTKDIREQRARQTLKQIIGEKQYRAYLRFGFVSICAKSGLVYQLPGNSSHRVKVFRNGQFIENLCVYLKGHFPPTDQLIVEYLMILNNEQEFRSLANIGKASKQLKTIPKIDTRPLSEIFRELKGAA